uniref:Uncharacterized protein n=1 Tax=Globodera rostochiensis TaxID=31243 RepID=A0A914GY54_GLORO
MQMDALNVTVLDTKDVVAREANFYFSRVTARQQRACDDDASRTKREQDVSAPPFRPRRFGPALSAPPFRPQGRFGPGRFGPKEMYIMRGAETSGAETSGAETSRGRKGGAETSGPKRRGRKDPHSTKNPNPPFHCGGDHFSAHTSVPHTSVPTLQCRTLHAGTEVSGTEVWALKCPALKCGH